MRIGTPALALAAAALLATALVGCTAPPRHAESAPSNGLRLVALGEHIPTSRGNVFVVRVQGEYRLIRCIPSGPIAGCYEDVLSVADADVAWNHWVDVDAVPGLRVAFVSPTDVAFVEEPAPISTEVMAK